MAQDNSLPQEQKWNVYLQATSIGQYHGSFNSPYEGPLSLISHPEAEVSLTTTAYLGLKLSNTQFYFNPEVAGGRGFSGTNGIADFPNGEMPRVATATPKPYLARLYVTQDFGFGAKRDVIEPDMNQVAGTRPATRLSITLGRFTVTDFFDNNRYSHDPRTQFMSWAAMYNGAWDYPADTRGYTWGLVAEFHTRNWALRYGGVAMPKEANGPQFDRRLWRNHGQVVEGEADYSPGGHPGAVRLLYYWNRATAGTYAEAIQLAEDTGSTPDVTATRKVGTLKYGFGISADQEIRKDIGVFGRLGWNDGKTESFAFTAIDGLASGGVSITGTRWKRREDTAASAVTVNRISEVHALYLARGGLDFLIGDGKLHYGPEAVWETYYSARLFPGFFATLDFQCIVNPAYNRDRGPVRAGSLRLHVEWGKGG
jgi:high affinity Mn2+ porin